MKKHKYIHIIKKRINRDYPPSSFKCDIILNIYRK